MRKDVSQHEQIIGFDPFRLAVVTAINDAVAMFGHQQMNDTLVQIAVRLAESVLNRHVLTHLPLPLTQTFALNTIDKKQFFALLQSTAFDVAMRCDTDVPLFTSGHTPAHRKYYCEYQTDNDKFWFHFIDILDNICLFCLPNVMTFRLQKSLQSYNKKYIICKFFDLYFQNARVRESGVCRKKILYG